MPAAGWTTKPGIPSLGFVKANDVPTGTWDTVAMTVGPLGVVVVADVDSELGVLADPLHAARLATATTELPAASAVRLLMGDDGMA